VAWTPYYDEPSNGRYLIHAGVGVVYTDDQDDTVRFRTRGGFDVTCRVVAVGVPGTKGGPAEVLYALTRSDGGARVRNGRPARTRAD